jgi:hypothetical protein
MSKKDYKIDEVIRSLASKGCIITDFEKRKIAKLMWWNPLTEKIETQKTEIGLACICVNNAYNLGNGSWGKIDFLTKYNLFSLYGLGTYKKRCELGI